jgi:DNA repair exonuclease SbcCD ATPase subunit
MGINIPMAIYDKLVEKFGKETAVEIAELIEDTQDYLEEKVVEETKKRKIELRDELRKELATKEDILLVRQEMETIRQELNGKIETVRQEIETVRQELNGKIESLRQELKGEIKVLKMWIFFLGALMVVLNQNSLELIARLLGSIFK